MTSISDYYQTLSTGVPALGDQCTSSLLRPRLHNDSIFNETMSFLEPAEKSSEESGGKAQPGNLEKSKMTASPQSSEYKNVSVNASSESVRHTHAIVLDRSAGDDDDEDCSSLLKEEGVPAVTTMIRPGKAINSTVASEIRAEIPRTEAPNGTKLLAETAEARECAKSQNSYGERSHTRSASYKRTGGPKSKPASNTGDSPGSEMGEGPCERPFEWPMDKNGRNVRQLLPATPSNRPGILRQAFQDGEPQTRGSDPLCDTQFQRPCPGAMENAIVNPRDDESVDVIADGEESRGGDSSVSSRRRIRFFSFDHHARPSGNGLQAPDANLSLPLLRNYSSQRTQRVNLEPSDDSVSSPPFRVSHRRSGTNGEQYMSEANDAVVDESLDADFLNQRRGFRPNWTSDVFKGNKKTASEEVKKR